jgi:hypothetical protein
MGNTAEPAAAAVRPRKLLRESSPGWIFDFESFFSMVYPPWLDDTSPAAILFVAVAAEVVLDFNEMSGLW